jgi:hypothetical protein
MADGAILTGADPDALRRRLLDEIRPGRSVLATGAAAQHGKRARRAPKRGSHTRD